jgi:lysine 6-dehydrogenase
MKKIVVLGSGLVGSAIAIDLKKNFDVTSVGLNREGLNTLHTLYGINTVRVDLTDQEEIRKLIRPYDLVVGALPGSMGFQTLKTLIEEGKNVVDISFMPEDFMLLDPLAKKNRVTAIVDCGIAPGMSNIVAGFYSNKMDLESYVCYVGGLPLKREWPYEYKAVFSPVDVIEEYVRPARFIQNGKLVIKEALSDAELLNFEPVGTLEAWNSDGLRSMLKTLRIPHMIEKTLRYPGCIEYLKVLRESGFFSQEKIDVNGIKIRPLDVTATLLFPTWKMEEEEEDFTVMRIIVKGIEQKRSRKYTWDLFDRYDRKTKTLSMARTTGYTCTAAVNLLMEGKIVRKGVLPPEYIGQEEANLTYMLKHLAERGVVYNITKS